MALPEMIYNEFSRNEHPHCGLNEQFVKDKILTALELFGISATEDDVNRYSVETGQIRIDKYKPWYEVFFLKATLNKA